jgi:hypothetical protein
MPKKKGKQVHIRTKKRSKAPKAKQNDPQNLLQQMNVNVNREEKSQQLSLSSPKSNQPTLSDLYDSLSNAQGRPDARVIFSLVFLHLSYLVERQVKELGGKASFSFLNQYFWWLRSEAGYAYLSSMNLYRYPLNYMNESLLMRYLTPNESKENWSKMNYFIYQKNDQLLKLLPKDDSGVVFFQTLNAFLYNPDEEHEMLIQKLIKIHAGAHYVELNKLNLPVIVSHLLSIIYMDAAFSVFEKVKEVILKVVNHSTIVDSLEDLSQHNRCPLVDYLLAYDILRCSKMDEDKRLKGIQHLHNVIDQRYPFCIFASEQAFKHIQKDITLKTFYLLMEKDINSLDYLSVLEVLAESTLQYLEGLIHTYNDDVLFFLKGEIERIFVLQQMLLIYSGLTNFQFLECKKYNARLEEHLKKYPDKENSELHFLLEMLQCVISIHFEIRFYPGRIIFIF